MVVHMLEDDSLRREPCAAPSSLDDSEEKVLTRLAITYGTLRRLGFSDARVEECLQAIPGVDTDEAYEWVSPVWPSE